MGFGHVATLTRRTYLMDYDIWIFRIPFPGPKSFPGGAKHRIQFDVSDHSILLVILDLGVGFRRILIRRNVIAES